MTFEKIRHYLSAMNFFFLQVMLGGPGLFCLAGHAGRERGNRKGSRKFYTDKRAFVSADQSVGGQAVIEGVMMRSPRRIATAVRKPDKAILTKNDPYIALSKRHKLLNIPVFRGALSFFEMLVIGLKALNFSADIALEESQRTEKGADWQRR